MEVKNRVQVLIVEDDLKAQQAVRSMLALFGYDITCAGNGEEALEIIQNKDFDIIFMDMIMPGMSGEETVRTLRKYLEKQTRVVAVTGKNMAPGLLMDLGIDGFILKPVDIRKMVDEIQKITTAMPNIANAKA